MIEKHIAMIADETNNGIVQKPVFTESAYESSDLMIDERTLCIECPESHFLLLVTVCLSFLSEETEDIITVFPVVLIKIRELYLIEGIHIEIRLKRDKRRMRELI